MGASKWAKAKMALGLGLKMNSCLYVSTTVDENSTPVPLARFSDVVVLSPTSITNHGVQMPTPSSTGSTLPNFSTSTKKICAICLEMMNPGCGHAIFTAECSHSFHFHCITSNVKYGKQSCPVCRAKWKEIPFQGPATDKSHARARVNNIALPQDDTWMARGIPSPQVDSNRRVASLFPRTEPGVFDDDDEIVNDRQSVTPDSSSNNNIQEDLFTSTVEVKTYLEVSAVPKSKPHSNFCILVHLKAPLTTGLQWSEIDGGTNSPSRAPVDLVAVLDVSGSMVGTKLALLKRAMGFVVQNLGPSDRLSVIAFSSTARRLFPLCRMTDTGKDEALQAVNSLTSNGGTNIAEGLRKSAKVISDRKWKNPVVSIILLSDGQDTYAISSSSSPNGSCTRIDYKNLLLDSMRASSLRIPVHTFGFGADHDAELMHLISETSGGTFSFIEAESVIQDAFAQCIGGLLSVVVQELKVEVECINPLLQLTSIKSGSYKTIVASDKRKGIVEMGDLYAEEERDFLVTIDIPIDESSNEMSLIKVKCVYNHPVSKTLVSLDSESDVIVQRPAIGGPLVVSIEVDKQRNRLRAAEAMAEARAAAEDGNFTGAASVLEKCRKELSKTVSSQAGERLCVALDAELEQMRDRMVNRHVYETSGRAYVLSGMSSHSLQRATARGDSTNSASLVQAYQTSSMVDMVTLSQTMVLGSPSSRPRATMKPAKLLSARSWRR